MYYYKVDILRVVDGDTVDVRLDLGFNVWHKCRVRMVGINAPESRTRDKEEKVKGLAAKAFLKDILENPKVHFIFGIDGTTDEVNQKYRIGVNTKLALSNMIVSAKHRLTRWDYTIFEHNYHQLQDAIDFAEDHGIYILARVNSRPFAKLNPNKLSYVEDILKKNRTNYYLCK